MALFSSSKKPSSSIRLKFMFFMLLFLLFLRIFASKLWFFRVCRSLSLEISAFVSITSKVLSFCDFSRGFLAKTTRFMAFFAEKMGILAKILRSLGIFIHQFESKFWSGKRKAAIWALFFSKSRTTSEAFSRLLMGMKSA